MVSLCGILFLWNSAQVKVELFYSMKQLVHFRWKLGWIVGCVQQCMPVLFREFARICGLMLVSWRVISLVPGF